MRRAFSLVEIVFALVIVSIVGATLVGAYLLFVSSFYMDEDYTNARLQIEDAIKVVSPQINNAGLGMPNDKVSKGSFCTSFSDSKGPITAHMGSSATTGRSGGPITIASGDIIDKPANLVTSDDNGCFYGPILYYAWAEPTGVVISSDIGGAKMAVPKSTSNSGTNNYQTVSQDVRYWNDAGITFKFAPVDGAAGIKRLIDAGVAFKKDKKSITSNWFVFPSFGVPFYVDNNDPAAGATLFDAKLFTTIPPIMLLGGTLYGYEEIHRVRAARLYVDTANKQLIQEVYNEVIPKVNFTKNILARSIAAVRFKFDPAARLLTMYVAGIGSQVGGIAATGVPANWPGSKNDFTPDDLQRRILVESITWRIRN